MDEPVIIFIPVSPDNSATIKWLNEQRHSMIDQRHFEFDVKWFDLHNRLCTCESCTKAGSATWLGEILNAKP